MTTEVMPYWVTATEIEILRARIDAGADEHMTWVLDLGALDRLGYGALRGLEVEIIIKPHIERIAARKKV